MEMHSYDSFLIMSTWNFQEALEGTVKEKYENEHIKVIEIDGVSARECGAKWNKLTEDAMMIYRLKSYRFQTPCKNKI